MNKLAVDIKDGYIILASGDSGHQDYLKIDVDETLLGGADSTGQAGSTGIFKLGNEQVTGLYNSADGFILSLPMRFSLIKPISIDLPAIEQFGEEFLAWEAHQQLPDELGQFRTGFYKLRESFDRKTYKYMFYAASRDFSDVLANFVSAGTDKVPQVESEAFGLLNIANLASGGQGLITAVSLEHDGAAVVVVHDGDFVAGRFITGDTPSLGEEIMYYTIAQSSEDTRPRLLVCGDLDNLDHLGSTSWAERVELPKSLNFGDNISDNDKTKFAVAAGLIMLENNAN